MNATQIVTLLVTIAGAFFKSSPAATEIEIVLPQLAAAFDGAKNGTAFSVSHSLSIDDKPGVFAMSWTPN